MKKIFLLLHFYLFLNCVSYSQSCLEIGARFQKECKSISKEVTLLSSSGQLEKALELTVGGINYKVFLNKKDTIRMIISNDSLLTIKNTIKIGSLFKNVQHLKVAGFYEKGWGYVVDIGDNWKCVFWDEFVKKTGSPNESSQVTFFVSGK